jgi:HEAT repeat protein
LSFTITRSLGRLGDPQAIEPLRQMLFCGYHLLEANAARALSMLGDVESLPHFLTKFNQEPNPVLKIAYASALGKVRAGEAIGPIFDLLRRTDNETYRAELGLALARIIGEENYYMQQWRLLHANPNTATAQALLALQKTALSAKQDTLAGQLEQCAAVFAQNEAAAGAARLQAILTAHHPADAADPLAQTMRACAAALTEFGGERMEIILLALHGLDVRLSRGE